MRLFNPVAHLLIILFSSSTLAQSPQTACLETEVDSFVTSNGASHLVEIKTPALGGNAGDSLVLEFSSSDAGAFDLGSGDNANYSSCLQCVLTNVDEGSGPIFFQAAGTLSVNGDPTKSVLDAEISDVILVEVTIDPITFVSTPVPEGDCLHIQSARLVTDSIVFEDGFEGEALPGCLLNSECEASAYCATTGEGMCGERGECTLLPLTCPSIYAPVCGCDGQNYGNACIAAQAGVNIDYQGSCN